MAEMEWPPRSGRKILVPGIDGAEFFTVEEAEKKINAAQALFLKALAEIVRKADETSKGQN
jgi:predicted NUDIX family NTP pyrophosphohydrolase